MRSLLIALAILTISGAVWTQEKPIESCIPVENPLVRPEKTASKTETVDEAKPSADVTQSSLAAIENAEPLGFRAAPGEMPLSAEQFAFVKEEREPIVKTRFIDQPPVRKPQPQTDGGDKFHWKPALIQSGLFLGIQHAARMYESKTRREFDGPFFRDWKNSVKNLRGWDDGGKFFTNYVAHPLQGAVTGRIFINNSDRARRQEFGKSKVYWESRLKALAWSAVWSTQFEIGPLSEASLGNVGLKPHLDGRSRLTWGDMIITPVVGTVWVVGEDAIDKYVLKNWIESKTSRKTSTGVKIARSLLTPTTSFSNLLRGKYPWKRDNRPN